MLRKLAVLIAIVCLGVTAGAFAAETPSKSNAKKKTTATAAKSKAKTPPPKTIAKATVTAKAVPHQALHPGAIRPVRLVTVSATSRPPAPLVRTANYKAPMRGPWRVSNYADSSEGDVTEGDDLTVRRAALDALGPLNGSVVVSDAETGRILSIVNQKLAYGSGFQPCSTVKVPVALAALSESLVERTTPIRVYGRTTFDMTTALAKSNNQYFASLGEKLGFERVSYYARLFGLGEKAALDIPQEQPGILPDATPKSGMGMMTSFGDGITITPLEMAALMGAVANGGTLYYLQYPKTSADADRLLPQVKRKLDIDQIIPEIKPGMMGAVEYGTARRIGFDPEDPIYGKTGTCTDTRTPTHLGWFGSFGEIGKSKLVVVVLLTGAKLVNGPTASGVAGQVYRNLIGANYFTPTAVRTTTTATNIQSAPGSSAK